MHVGPALGWVSQLTDGDATKWLSGQAALESSAEQWRDYWRLSIFSSLAKSWGAYNLGGLASLPRRHSQDGLIGLAVIGYVASQWKKFD